MDDAVDGDGDDCYSNSHSNAYGPYYQKQLQMLEMLLIFPQGEGRSCCHS